MTTSIDTVVLDASAVLKQPDISRLTTASVDGTGVFDILMRSAKQHLLEEYNADRVTGDEYTKLYLGTMTAVMQTAVQYILNVQQEEKIQAEIALVRQKTVTELAQTDDDIPVGLGFNGDTNVEGLIALEKEKLRQSGLLVDAQIAQAQTSEALLGQQIVTELARTCDDFTLATVAGYGFNASNVLQGLLELEKAITEQKLVTELANTSDTKPADLGLMTGTTVITGLVDVQKKKAEAENALLAQKTNTELAQTSDMVKVGAPYLNTSTTVAGVIGTQNALYAEQTKGFTRDAEQKVLKMVLDTWGIAAANQVAVRSEHNGLDDPSLLSVLNKARVGIGLAPVVPPPVTP